MQKTILTIAITSLFLSSCLKDKPGITNEIITTKLGNLFIDSTKFQNRDVDNPQPALNWVTLMAATVTSYTLDFSWIWGKANAKQGGGSLTISNITIHSPIGGFAVSSIGYTNYTGSALATITITGHPTHLVMNTILHTAEIVKDSELVTLVTQFNANTGVFNMQVTTKK